jgi:ankyrin repeat protein
LSGLPKPSRSWFRRGPDPAGLRERAAAWFAELTGVGQVGRDEHDLVHMLGAAERRMTFYPATPDAMGDLTICARLRDGEPVEVDATARLRAAVACADLAALRVVLAGDRTAGPVWLARVGESRCVVVGDTLIHTGSSPEDMRQVLTELHDAGLDVDEPVTESGGTLLFDAAVRDAELTAFLLATGADVHHRDRNGVTALAEAARCGSWQAVTVLVEAGSRPDERDGEGRTALHHAVMSDSTETVARVIAGGATVTATDASGVTPLAHARTAAMVMLLCQAGVDPNAADVTGRTPLMAAAGRGDVEIVEVLLRQGADPNAVTDAGEVALHHAAMAPRNRVDVVTALLDAGAELDEETDEGMTALMVAAMHVHDDAVASLLARGVDPNARTVHGHTALMQASDGRTEWTRDFTHNDRMMKCMRLLTAAGADVDAADDAGWTALHYACLGFDAGPVEQLLQLGANPNVRSEDGSTPLGQAKARGHEKMIEDLLKAGAQEEIV